MQKQVRAHITSHFPGWQKCSSTNSGACSCQVWVSLTELACCGRDPTPSSRTTELTGVVIWQVSGLQDTLGAVAPGVYRWKCPIRSIAESVPQWRGMLYGEEVEHQLCSPCMVQKRRCPLASLPFHLPYPRAMKCLLSVRTLPVHEKSRARETENLACIVQHCGCSSPYTTPLTWLPRAIQNTEQLTSLLAGGQGWFVCCLLGWVFLLLLFLESTQNSSVLAGNRPAPRHKKSPVSLLMTFIYYSLTTNPCH